MLLLRPIRRGFTIAELIIVMMIIVLLVAILLPALSSARNRAKRVAAQAQMTAISAACSSYQLAFNSAPGPVPESVIDDDSLLRNKFTGTENLVLALLGRTSSSSGAATFALTGTSPALYADLDAIGAGPVSPSGRAYGAFYSPKPDELGEAVKTYKQSATNGVPELLDISSKIPILYFRTVGNESLPPVGVGYSGGTPQGQVVRRTSIDFIRGGPLEMQSGESIDQGGKSLFNHGVVGNPTARNNLAWALVDKKLSSLTTGNGGANTASAVLTGDGHLLAPGPDGIYFSSDQIGGATEIMSADDVEKFDDIVVSFN